MTNAGKKIPPFFRRLSLSAKLLQSAAGKSIDTIEPGVRLKSYYSTLVGAFSSFTEMQVSFSAGFLFKKKKCIARGGFEPPLPAPKASMLDHYTTGLFCFSAPLGFVLWL